MQNTQFIVVCCYNNLAIPKMGGHSNIQHHLCHSSKTMSCHCTYIPWYITMNVFVKFLPRSEVFIYISHWSKSLVVSPESVQGFSNHFLTLFLGVFQEQKMDITLGHDCQFVNCKTKICLCLISF